MLDNKLELNKVYKIKTLDLLKLCMKDNDFSYDIYFRIAVVRNYLLNQNSLWDLYKKMQVTRKKQITQIPDNMIDHKDEFINLIHSFEINGFDKRFPLLINNKFDIIDGAHRMACALYFNIEEVYIYTNCEFYNFCPREYTKKWFLDNDLSEIIDYAEVEKSEVKNV